MTARTTLAVIAVAGSVGLNGYAAAADLNSGETRNWGGVWLGFGAGYAGSTGSRGGFGSDICLTETRESGGTAILLCTPGDGVSSVQTNAYAGPVSRPDASAVNSGFAESAQTANQGFATLQDDVGIRQGYGSAVYYPPGDTYAGSVTSATETGAVGVAQGGGTQVIFAQETFETGYRGTGASAVATGAAFFNASTGLHGAASYAAASSVGGSAEALAMAFGGLQDISLSDTSGGLTPNINVRFDHQTEGNIIFGAELDLSVPGGSDVSDVEVTEITGIEQELSLDRGFAMEPDMLASARLRIGYAMGDYMAYGTGGIAYSGYDATVSTTGTYNGKSISESASESGSAFGGVIGGGVSAFVSDNAAVSIEGLYYRFDEAIDFESAGEDVSVELEDAFSLMMKFSLRMN